ncbi:MAG: hypothetical protein J7604_25825 [Sporocytophaga sp.]|uniref:hypothetical protein n=1 Tax=Sporocytophaga sp. TaxID=2231183 RepID=UPI001B14DD32|nr:hypothetical protein [Sporocytophaga sp.]MBO9703650.1 hypothetical protein [Sporocytophaga sp.]
MSAINLLLQSAVDYERTHQIILYTLLKDINFQRLFLDIDVEQLPVWEPLRGKFDLGIAVKKPFEAENISAVFELKMWSNISEGQLKSQKEYLYQNENVKGFHILLGTCDYEYKDDYFQNVFGGRSVKISTCDLVDKLEQYKDGSEVGEDIKELVEVYIEVLKGLMNDLNFAYKRQGRLTADHFFYYSLYKKIQDLSSEQNLRIYKVNNRNSPSYIINDIDTWMSINYQGYVFRLYQEILNGEYQIRLHSNPETPDIHKRVLKDLLLVKLSQSNLNLYDLEFRGKLTKYAILARKRLSFENEKDIEGAGDLFRIGNRALRIISDELNCQAVQLK